MGALNNTLYYLIRPNEVRSIIQWKLWHNPVHERNFDKETVTEAICFDFLEKTSRSFSAVIQELHPKLLMPIALFYLILRGLDTIEDDMTISATEKDPLLRNFHNILEEDGWTFKGNGPEEKDRELLVNFNTVIQEYKKVPQAYRTIINDITGKMGAGMADFANNAEFKAGVRTVKEYELYCHYVAGLVGEGLTRLFVESGFGNPALMDRPHLQESMGQFLQKTNIIRDIREDFDDKRRFWPQEIWSKHVDKFEHLFDNNHKEAALNCGSEMVLNALTHADECLFYLAGLKEQSVFNFAAIPQSMAIATLELVFRNPAIFERNVKITKGQACHLMVSSSQNLTLVTEVFREHLQKIQKKNDPRDPNFLAIAAACARVEQFIQSIFPSQNVALLQAEAEASEKNQRVAQHDPAAARRASEEKWDLFIMLIIVMGSLLTLSCIMIGVAYYLGARFDVLYNGLKEGKLPNPSEEARSVLHGEL